jgi:sucrose phosphorylase
LHNLSFHSETPKPVAAVGEVLWDIFPNSIRLGGAPLNFGVHARRLGYPVFIVSATGADERGKQAAKDISALALDTSFLQTSFKYPTGTATVALSAEDKTSFLIHRPAAYDAMQFADHDVERLKHEKPDWLYFGTLFASRPEGRSVVDRVLDRLTETVKFYDLNLRPFSDSPELVKHFLERADVVKLNEDELRQVHEFCDLPSSIEGFCREGAARYGWRAVGVTLGARGCALLAQDTYVEEAGRPVHVADTVGAGDAFAAAFMHGLNSKWPLRDVAAFSNRIGATSPAAGRDSRLDSRRGGQTLKNQVQLITYVDRLSGGGFQALRALLEGPLADLFGGIHLLPFYHPIDGDDAGFDPIDHTQPDPRLGSWNDARELAEGKDLMADLIVNHMSSRSPQFEDFRRNGDSSRYAELFLTYGRVFPKGATEQDLLSIYRIRPSLPFTAMKFDDGGERVLWTTFTSAQIDIDVASNSGRAYLEEILDRFQAAGVSAIRLDAAGFAIKKAGTSCFMIPETFEFISGLTSRAHARSIGFLWSAWAAHEDQIQLAQRVDWVYDFALPPLVLHALYAEIGTFKQWLSSEPRNAVTVLDTHDGIGVIDAAGLLTSEEIENMVETIHQRSRNESRQASGEAANNLDVSQVNCTFYEALGRHDEEHSIARLLQFFSPGVPQVYYVGLFAGSNDMDLLRRTKEGRDINRHHYTAHEIDLEIRRPVVRALFELIRFRNTHPAFTGEFRLLPCSDHEIAIEWRNNPHWARLNVDLKAMNSAIDASPEVSS